MSKEGAKFGHFQSGSTCIRGLQGPPQSGNKIHFLHGSSIWGFFKYLIWLSFHMIRHDAFPI